MKKAIDETNRRRTIQRDYNEANGITPQTIIKAIDQNLIAISEMDYVTIPLEEEQPLVNLNREQKEKLITDYEEKMREAARNFEFEKAASYRDKAKEVKEALL